jgi:FMN phosphatase YigB (HAD superfamily)
VGGKMSKLEQVLQQYQEKNIAVYGLGSETERLLDKLGTQYHIAGLLDSFREEGEFYGKPVISLKETVEKKVGLILVAARPGSCKAIARKIEAFCKENRIAVFDIRGNDLYEKKNVVYDFKNVTGITKAEFMRRLENSEVISVDLFDTLIMRRTLFATDVIELTDEKLKEQGIVIEKFCDRRLESEKYLSQKTAPTLVKIYEYMLEKYDIQNVTAQQLAELEWKLDYELVVPRSEICEAAAKAYEGGKEVYIVSDTYYTKQQLVQLLDKCKITKYTQVLASCEYQTGKTQQLFEVLKERLDGKSCIHIGDDDVADIQSARKYGISACKICSGPELLEKAGYMGLSEFTKTLSDRIRIGIFVSVLFNSPFQFETQEKKITIRDAYELGVLLFAPMISDFVIWFKKQAEKYDIKNIWFGARDGYLIKKMYDMYVKNRQSIYFLTSRTAAIRSGIQDEEAIRYIEEMRFSGTLKEQMQNRLGITVDKEKSRLTDYKQEILQHAAVCRTGYQKYIAQFPVKNGDIAFFDFVAKGTCQLFMSRIVDAHLKGFYFLRLEEEQMKDRNLDIVSFYESSERDNSVIFDDYYILETMLTSPMPSVAFFDEYGSPVYAEETRSLSDIECFQKAQDGILDYFKIYTKICPNRCLTENKKLDEVLLSLIHKISIEDETFLKLKVEDAFFNRMTEMPSLI